MADREPIGRDPEDVFREAPDPEPISRQLWGVVPIRVHVDPQCLKSGVLGQPEPCYFMAPRMGFLYLVLDTLKDHFAAVVDESRRDMVWFHRDKEPLMWHYPVGVLLDMVVASKLKGRRGAVQTNAVQATIMNQARGEVLPFTITVHFGPTDQKGLKSKSSKDPTSFPDEVVLPQHERAHMLLHNNQLKSAVMTRYGTTTAFVDFVDSPHNHLHKAVRNNDADLYYKCRWYLSLRCESDVTDGKLFYPVMFIVNGRPVQRRVPSHIRTFGFLVKEYLGHVAPMLRNLTPSGCNYQGLPPSGVTLFVGGTTPYLNTPMEFLYDVMASADMFLHVICYTDF